jgi:hypothetical protein
VSTDGIAGFYAGQPLADVQSRWQINSAYSPGDLDDINVCNIYNIPQDNISIMVENGRVTSVSTDSAYFRTKSGISPGSTEADLKKAYTGQLKVEENIYGGTNYYYYSNSGNGIKFYVDSGRVMSIFAGGDSIEYVEGCL